MKVFIFIIIIIKVYSYNIYNISSYENKTSKNLRKLNIFDIFRKKNLIIGAIINYNWNIIQNYFISLKKAGFENCDIVMYVGKMDEETKEKLKSLGVILYDIPDEYYKSNYLINSFRFNLYEKYLLKNRNKYNLVFASDVRDIIFQKDIFKFYEKNKKPFLGISIEDGIINQNLFNIKWTQFYCPEENILNQTTICSGTIIGTVNIFIEFCHTIWKYIGEKAQNITIARDQGAMNCLIRGKKFMKDYLIIMDNQHGPVMTISLSKDKNLILDNDNNLLDYDGKIAAVVHQYDRHKKIADKFNKKFNVNSDINSFIKEINPKKSRDKKIRRVFIIIYIFSFFAFIIYLVYFLLKKKKIFKKNKKKIKMKKIKIESFKKMKNLNRRSKYTRIK